MNVATITCDPETAKKKLAAYRADKHKDTEEEYAAAAEAYAALAEGTPLLKLSEAFRSAGVGADGRPILAIARADRDEVRFQWLWNDWPRYSSGHFYAGPLTSNGAPLHQGRDSATLTRQIRFGQAQAKEERIGYAPVPLIPADVRPKHGQRRSWFILWEVEQWADRSKHAPAPRDPLLLRHLRGDLYAVLAAWDLTEVERAIMEEARS